jgi:hypothetical protein
MFRRKAVIYGYDYTAGRIGQRPQRPVMRFQIPRKKPSAMEKDNSRQTNTAVRVIYSNGDLVAACVNQMVGNGLDRFRLAAKRGNLPVSYSRRLDRVVR